ncbi:hypothetical protein, partial [Clostridium botulinum]|uniref:hypothetical protein n=1 Tax=Clostridium botulinum TaxID=1491 RepID=UPI0004D6080E
YNKSQGIEFSASWRSVFELLVLCKDKNRIRKFYSSIDNYINKLSFDLLNEDEVISKRKNVLLNKLKFSLKSKLNSASALAIALNYESGTYKRKKLAIKFRNSNMMNHKLIAYPLMNYSNSDIFKNIVSLIDLNNQLLNFKNIKELFKLDEEKLKWSPRFIHLNELYFYMFFYFIGVNRKFYIDNNDEVFKEYLKINNLPKNISNPVIEDDIIDINGISIKTQNINVFERNIPNKTRIGLVNTQISETNILKYMLNPSSGMTIDNKKRLYKVLKAAHEQKVKYLVFPEFYLPVIWVNDINNFARQYGITVITGLQYITHNKRAYNIVYIAKSVQSKFGFRNCIPLYREKNNYAPNEKLQLAKLGYKCKDATQPMYYIINNGTLSIGIILCFEFTDINSRAGMKSKVDILFIPQLNRDTNYFASIVESSARDLHCFIVQANTSAYGDSRITAPYKTNFKDIVRIKGGINDIVIVGEVNVAELKKQHKTYNINLQAQINKCIKCTKIKDKIKDIKKIEEKCSKCKDNWNRKGTMKGLPPKF